MTTLRFERADLERFAAASLDRNPLHLSDDHARRSAFGEPVVFGILGALAALGTQPIREGEGLQKASITFRSPLFVGVDYRVVAQEKKAGALKLSVIDSGNVLLTATFTYRTGTPAAWSVPESPGSAPTAVAASRSVEDMSGPLGASGQYSPPGGPFLDLARRLRAEEMGLSPAQFASLLWSSYLVGMELPGERAVFSTLEIVFPDGATAPTDHVLDYEARVSEFDERFDLLQIAATLTQVGHPLAEARLSSFVRRDTPELSLDDLSAALPPSEALRGKTALIVGGSRGLGAALVAALASQGCRVRLGYRAGSKDAARLKERLRGVPGPIELWEGDASDPDWGHRLKSRLAETGGLDLLIANASPPLRPLGFSTESCGRLLDFVNRSLALTAVPLSACLDSLAARSGRAVLISSAVASETPGDHPADWMHYVAAKHASEGLFRSLARQAPSVRFLIARPPRLLTDQTNTTNGRIGARAVEGIAAAIVARLIAGEHTEGVEVLDL